MEEALRVLHAKSEETWNDAFRQIWSNEKLGKAAEIGVCLVVPFNQIFEFVPVNNDERVVKFLFGRIYNSTRAGLELLLYGFVQPAFTMLRDAFECLNLLEFFLLDRAAIQRWAAVDPDKPIPEEFRQVSLRKKLEATSSEADREGRRRLYQNLSQHAAHPSYGGAHMLDRDGDGTLRFGPLFQARWIAPYVDGMKIVLPRAVMTMPSLLESMPDEFKAFVRKFFLTFDALNTRYEERFGR